MGRPIEVTTRDMVKEIHDIVLADRRVKIGEIADVYNISTERIQNILQERWCRVCSQCSKNEIE